MSEMMAGGGGMPPELAALLGGGGGAPPAPEAPAPEQGDTTDLIRQALELVRQYAQAEESEQNTLDAEKITSLLQGILASEEKELEDAMQGKASPRVLRKAYSG